VLNLGCTATGNVTFIIHGFTESNNPWAYTLGTKFLAYRKGCVIYVNWGFYGDKLDYVSLVTNNFTGIAESVTTRLRAIVAEGVSPDNIMLFGLSLGARISIQAGLNFGERQIGNIDGEINIKSLFSE